jgi:ADP-ribosyl-[dinitrogen reductase] hydrolase
MCGDISMGCPHGGQERPIKAQVFSGGDDVSSKSVRRLIDELSANPGAPRDTRLRRLSESQRVRVENLGHEVMLRNMRWFHLPIVDLDIPGARFEAEWKSAGAELCSMLRQKSDILVHCRGGMGRAGTIAARLLVELGMTPAAAIAAVRAVRPRAIETRQQEQYVLGLLGLAGNQ